MRSWTIAFLFGIAIINCLPQAPALTWPILIFLSLLLFYYFSPLKLKVITRLFLSFTLGLLWMSLCIHWQLAKTLPKNLEGKKITVIGTIASIPQRQNRITRFNFDVNKVQILYKHFKTRLNWYNNFSKLHVGEKLQLSVKLKRPHGFMNPGGFDFEAWLFQNRISARGYVLNRKQNHVIQNSLINHPIDRIREYINSKIKQTLKDNPTNGLIRALTIGVRNGISKQQWQIFRRTGTSHLMAISGLHIGLCAGFWYLLIGALWRRLDNMPLRLPTPQASAIGALVGALLYSALAGFALTTQRALIMISVFMLGIMMRKKLPPWNALLLSLFIILCLDPFATLSAGFWLSFSAVGIMIYGLAYRLCPTGVWWKYFRSQWVVSFGLVPLTLLLFQQASLISIIANTIAIPFVGFTVVPLSIIGSLSLLIMPSIGAIFLKVAALCLAFLLPILKWLGSFHGVVLRKAIPTLWVFGTSIIGVLLILAPRGFPGRFIGIFWLLPLFFLKAPHPKHGDVWFSVLDVGQGLSSVIRTEHHTLVYDTGPKYNPNFDTGQAVVLPYLKSQGIQKIDVLVISHGDNDHIGGVSSILADTPVNKIVTSVPKKLPKVKTQLCIQGESWSWDGVYFRFLYPPKELLTLGNESSCVLQITTGKQQILLTGDIEKKAEKYLLEHDRDELPSEILVAPHHGSRTSSTEDFVNAVDPKYVLFPVGYLNRYHFPSTIVIGRYKRIGSALFDTSSDGAISFKIIRGIGIIAPTLYRSKHKRYWNNTMLGFATAQPQPTVVGWVERNEVS